MKRGYALQIRMSADEMEVIRGSAKENGLSLSAYVRFMLLRNSTLPSLGCGLPTTEKEKQAKAIKKSGPTCKHGVEKGWNCWQCGGLAQVKEA